MYGKRFGLLLLCLGLAASSSAAPTDAVANAQQTCAKRDAVLQHLSGNYRETPVAMGLANNGGVIEVMRSADRKTFTIIITMPDGITCMIAAGESWESVPQRLASAPGI